MDFFKRKLNSIKNGVKISDMFEKGTFFEIDTTEEDNSNDADDIDFSNFPGSEDNLIPIDTPFNELKTKMDNVADGVWKKVYKEAPNDAIMVDFSRHRVTYHRNMYLEEDSHPFDSTWLNGKPDVINSNETHQYLEGILDALSTMKEGEQSYFVISYRKLFKEQGCEPRVSPNADIFCDLKVLRIEEVGDQNNINQLFDDCFVKSFQDVKIIYNDGRLRAKKFVEDKKIQEAIKIYEKITQLLEFCEKTNDDEIRECKEMIINNFTNLGICYNLHDEPNKTIDVIRRIEAVTNISNNPKILLMKGKALRMTGEYKFASIVLQKANRLCPNDAIAKEMAKLDSSVAKYKEYERGMSKIVGNLHLDED